MLEIKICCRCFNEHKNMFESNRERFGGFVDCEYTCPICGKVIIVRLSFDGDIEQYHKIEESIKQ